MRYLVLAIAIGAAVTAALDAPAAKSATAEEFMETCKASPDQCRSTILARTAALESAHKACMPPDISREEAAIQVADTIEDVLEEAGDAFNNADAQSLIDQIVEFRWSCVDQPIS